MAAASPPQRRRQCGVALVEFALVGGLLLGLFAAVIDFGFGWRRSIEVAGTLRSGVRVAANLGDDRNADLEALRALNAGIAEIGPGNILKVVVYEANGADGEVPDECLALTPASSSSNGAGIAGSCNVYSPSQLQSLDAGRFGPGCTAQEWDEAWCPTAREADQGASGGADYVGIYIEVRFDWVVGVLPGSGTVIRDHVVMRLEPTL